MNDGCVEIFCGNGRGKTSMALGKSIRSCSRGNSVVIIQFLKGRETGELNYLNNMNLDIKLFRFEKSDKFYEELDEQEQAEQTGRSMCQELRPYVDSVTVVETEDLNS